jgi:UDP-N-acetylmuramoyl-L-alanyl-D-glutamate--2,6-diaminopimelate ligase
MGRVTTSILKPGMVLSKPVFNDYRQHKVKQVAMEVSSHALSLHRADGIEFKQALFTNLTRDHLDFHHTMENYAQAKGRLFAWPNLQQAILNMDDPYASYMADQVRGDTSVLYYSMESPADVWVKSWQMGMAGTFMEVESPFGVHTIEIAALGRFNMSNALAIFTSLLVAGYSITDIEEIMPRLRAAPGRLEVVGESPCVIVDYAHTPDALANALQTLQQVKKGKLWVIFGCGGDRDKGKRSVMGQVAQQYADQLVVTSDNPRSEDPEMIIDDILTGIKAGRQVAREADRALAIRQTIESASADDIILIAGKGHEDYQLVGDEKRPFSDRAQVEAVLRAAA